MPFGITPFSLGAAVFMLAATGLDLYLLRRRTPDPAARQTASYRGHVAFQVASAVAVAGTVLLLFREEGGGPIGRDLLLLWVGLGILRLLWRWRQHLRGEPVP